jgi:hypothetical protein
MSLDLAIDVKLPDTALFRGEGAGVVTEQLTADTEYAVNALQAAVVPATPVGANAFLRNAWGTDVRVGGTDVDVLGRVFNPMGYALPVERGARPHFPPVDALMAWVRRKLQVPEKLVRSVAFLVARKISRRGTSGAAMAYRAVQQATPAIQARFRAGLAAITEKLSR